MSEAEMLVPSPPARSVAEILRPRAPYLRPPLYWLRLDRVGPRRRRVARELRRLDPCLSPGLVDRALDVVERKLGGRRVYIAGALSAEEAMDAAISFSRAGARVKVIETPVG